MNSREQRFLRREALKWYDEGWIDQEQYDRIVARYSRQPINVVNLLYVFAALLVGLGAILFVIANWVRIPDVVQAVGIYCLMIIITSAGFMLRRVRPQLGMGLLFLGTMLFGAGIWVTDQIVPIWHYEAYGFLYWSLCTGIVAYVVRSPLLFIAGVVQLSIFGLMSVDSNVVSWAFYVVYGLLMVPFMVRQPLTSVLVMGMGCLALVTSVVVAVDYGLLGVASCALVLLGMVWFLSRKLGELESVGVTVGTVTGYIGVVFLGLGPYYRVSMDPLVTGAGWLLLLAVVAGEAAVRQRQLIELAPFLLFVPYFMLFPTPLPVDLITLSGVAGFAVVLLIAGGRQGLKYQINLGAIYFLSTTVITYFHLARDFLSAAGLFTGAGIVLFVVGLMVERGRRRLLVTVRGEV